MMYMLPNTYTNGLMDLFDEFERGVFGPQGRRSPTFSTDILDKGEHYLLQAELPGFQKENIDLDINENILTISAQIQSDNQKNESSYLCRERRFGSFKRSFRLEGIQEENISASYTNGVLELILPKQQKILPQSRKISIE